MESGPYGHVPKAKGEKSAKGSGKDDKKPRNYNTDEVVALFGGLQVGRFTFPTEGESAGQVKRTSLISKAIPGELYKPSRKGQQGALILPFAFHVIMELGIGQVKSDRVLRVKINKLHITGRLAVDQQKIDKDHGLIAKQIAAKKGITASANPVASQSVDERSVHMGQTKGEWERPKNVEALVAFVNADNHLTGADVFSKEEVVACLNLQMSYQDYMGVVRDIEDSIRRHIAAQDASIKLVIEGDKSFAGKGKAPVSNLGSPPPIGIPPQPSSAPMAQPQSLQ
jgi:hypothetical protein